MQVSFASIICKYHLLISFARMPNLKSFQDYCQFYDITHYADRQSYRRINSLWSLIHNEIKRSKLAFPNYESFMDYLIHCHNTVENKYKFTYWAIIREFQRYQINAEIFATEYTQFMNRLKGYSLSRGCKNLIQLKNNCTIFLKHMRVGEKVDEDTRDFIIMSRYICDYLEQTPDGSPPEIPADLFASIKTALTT